MYLRITRRFPAWWYTEIVAEYRRHGSNMTRDSVRVLKSALLALAFQHDQGLDERARRAYRAGVRFLHHYYGAEVARQLDASLAAHDWRSAAASALALLRYYPQGLWSIVSR